MAKRGSLTLAAELRHADHNQEVVLAELGALADPARVPQVVASALRIPEQPGRAPLDVLVDGLHEREVHLLLDNCEHLISACAELVSHLLSHCSQLRVIATSREPLAVPGETAWCVPSLQLPEAEATPDVASVGISEAAQLFVTRARSVLPTFGLSEHDADAVARLCRRLDGIPLALELAAARVSALSVQQIAERLDDAVGLLTFSSRTAAPRQQTLEATLDWSYGLLTNQEQHGEEAVQEQRDGAAKVERRPYPTDPAHNSVLRIMGDETLRDIARELVETVRRNATVDWQLKESARARLRVIVKRVLRKHGYPPDKQERATLTVLQQAELFSEQWLLVAA